MSGTLESQSIRLEVISAKNLKFPSDRIPAGIYISIDVHSRRRWKSAIGVLLSDKSVAWGDTVTLSSQVSSALSIQIRVSYELDRMLGNGEVIGKLETSGDELLDHGDEPFELSFPPVCGVRPSLALKVAVVHAFDNLDGALFDVLVDCEIARDTDAGHARFAIYMTRKGVSHLNNAVTHFQLVLACCPVGHPDHAAALTNLAWARLEGYIRQHPQDIDNITSLFREALALRPQGHPDCALSLYGLIQALTWRYSRERTADYIHESAQLCCKLLPLCPEGTYLRSICVDSEVDYVIPECNDLPTDASNEGIRLRRNVLELCPPGHQHRPRALDELARAVDARFDQHGSIDDLEESIQLGREAVSLCPEEHSSRDTYLNNLAFSLKSRFNHQGTFHDLDEAITLYEEALRLCPVGHESRDFSLDNLGLALRSRFIERDDIDDISRAISLHREALTLRPSGNSSRETTLNNLALALQNRFERLHVSEESAEDLNEAIYLYRESLRLEGHDDPERYKTLHNLSSALCDRFTRTQKNEDVKEAIDLCKESLLALPSLHPDRYYSYMRLQEAYLSRYRVHNNPVDLSLAVENFRLASGHPTHGFPQRIQIALNWVDGAESHQHDSALEAYQICLELFDNHVMTRSSIISRREAATAFYGVQSLPVDAASCAIRSNDLQRAVELVEQGRGQQWSLASRLRSPLEHLESTNPILAHKFSELSKCLSDAQGSTGSTDRAAADHAAIKYRKLTNQWDAVVTQIRGIQAFSRFLLPPSYAELQVAACHGPVIILIASEYSCSAIIVPTSGEPHHVAFPRITLADLEQLKDDFATTIRHTARMHPRKPREKLQRRLRVVWDEIMLPIVNVLQDDLKLQRQSRIWLCPTAAFTSIPLHAANPFRSKADRSGPEACLEDIFICSYTPTLSALIRSRQKMETCVTQTFVAIGQGEPGAGQGEVLPAVNIELELVHELIPPNVKFTNLSKDEATQAGALDALRHNTWVHLACHGKQDLEQPYNSSFAMRDKPLTLLDIMENNCPQAEFAFLSACHTAVGDEVTPEEAIHLAAGLQFSGFKSVVGTLWGVNDALAKHFVEAFYEKMFEDMEDGVMDCTNAAHAVNYARNSVKTKVPLEQRIVFVHIASKTLFITPPHDCSSTCITQNEKGYPDASRFIPERFIDVDGALTRMMTPHNAFSALAGVCVQSVYSYRDISPGINTMPKKDTAPAIPDVHWSEDMTWSLLSEVEKDDNRLVLLGKREKKENTSGDSKITVFQRIGAVVLPESYKLNPTATGKAVKRKYDHLTRKYRQHGKRLRTTGEGIRGSDVEDNPSENEFFDCYVPAGGPDSMTTTKTKSIWGMISDEIVAKFPFFPVLHRILSSRPNITPIAVTTGVGPHGKKTLHFQPPSDNEDDDIPPFTPSQHMQMQSLHDILTAAVPRRELSPSFEFSQDPFVLDTSNDDIRYDDGEKENAPPLSQVTPARRPPKPSSMSQDILERAKQRIAKVPKKRGMEEVLLELQTKNMDAINARADAEMRLKSRDLLLREFTAGIWTVEQYRERLEELEHDPANPRLPKRARARYSPDWDEIE
ncbi:CHAT domain-containing protein [Suillus clintonianus]|uniref:CHAT domain-containing protein n=1 Tax=Suillus clintonianus TaxID=1904413 RepID=UPI001B85BF51|nr:CHAT domain-containing protein [Suillus clintonianus]KAG2123246.1 CHAT domain-containing protein [Suillus clintonianus]